MKLKIAKLPGDGIGPEVVEQAVKVVDAVCRKFGHEVEYSFGYVGACAIDRYGDAFPDETYKMRYSSEQSETRSMTMTLQRRFALSRDCSQCARSSASTPTCAQ